MKDLKNKLIKYFIAFLVCGVVAFFMYQNSKNDNANKITNTNDNSVESNIPNETKTFEDQIIGLQIDEKMYIVELENNESAHEFLLMTPLEVDMEDADDIKKYCYLSNSISGEEQLFENVKAGDVMISNNNLLVIFYKDTSISEKFIKIGHIEKFENIEAGTVTVSFVR